MTDTSLRDWPPSLLELRLACEECHKRKIRCEAPREGSQGACQACRANHRTCLFSLRNKTGRPRKSKSSPAHQAPEPLAPRPHELQTSPRSQPPALMTAVPLPYDFSRRQSRAEHQVHGRASSMTVHDANQQSTGDGDHHAGCGDTHDSSRQILWLPAIETTRGGLDPLLGSPFSGEPPTSPGLGHLADDFVFHLPESVATQPAFSAFLHNEHHEPWQRERSKGPVTWTTPSTGEPSDGSASRDSGQTDSGPAMAAPPGGNEDTAVSRDFFETMRLCTEMNNRHQSKVLDVTARSDERELSVLLGNIEELGHRTVAAMLEVTTPSGQPSSRQGHYNWMLTHVAVMGAVDIAADLVLHNLSIHKIEAPPPREAGIEDGPSFGLMDPTAPSYGRGRREGQGDEASSGGGPSTPLKSVLSLVRLDYALLQFSLFLSAENCDVEECPGPFKGPSTTAYGCPRGRRQSTLTRMAQVRGMVWALAEGLRKLW